MPGKRRYSNRENYPEHVGRKLQSARATSATLPGSSHWHKIVSRIDLAKAYQEMGDKDSPMVRQEVMREEDAPPAGEGKIAVGKSPGTV